MSHPHRPLARIAAATFLLALTPTAQEPQSAGPTSNPWPADLVLTDRAADGSVAIAGPTYKAIVTTDGLDFVPFVGSDTHVLPVRFRVGSITVGGIDLLDGGDSPQLAGARIHRRCGGATERFEATAAGIEQSFEFTTLPNRGAIAVALSIETELRHESDGMAHRFRDARGFGVDYGAATAIDALGRTLRLESKWRDGAIVLEVPAEFVAKATLPLVIDPLIGAAGQSPGLAQELVRSDIAYDASQGQFYVAYERAFSSIDHDVYVTYLDQTMTVQGVLVIDITTAWWGHAAIATVESHDMACVVAETSSGALNVGPRQIRARMFHGGVQPGLLPPFVVDSHGTFDRLNPDIGGDSTPSGESRFLVAYERVDASNDSTCVAVRVDRFGGVGAPATLLAGTGYERDVAVSKTCGRPGGDSERWCLVMRTVAVGASVGRLAVGFIGRDGLLRDAAGPLSFVYMSPLTDNAGVEWDVSSPTDDANGRRFLCVERREDPLTGQGLLLGHLFDEVGVIVNAEVILLSGLDRRSPAVDSDGCRFVFANSTRFSSTDYDVRVNTVGVVGTSLIVQDAATISASAETDIVPAVCAMPGLGTNDYCVSWIRGSGGTWTANARRYWGVGVGSVASRPTACGPLTIAAVGNAALGEQIGFVLTQTSGQAGILFGLPAALPIPGCPGCTLGALGQFHAGTTLTLTVPCDAALVGGYLSFQGLDIVAAGGACLSQFVLGNTLDVRLR
ncbi:MAG: hypothetical protein AB7I19_07350 [Planctomycetota bacterium]